jgi:hypothetical protein
MGIDIWASWDGERGANDAALGDVRYLREAYHGGPYVTHYLLSEVFANPGQDVFIPAETLRRRLPEALRIAVVRERIVYHSTDEDLAAARKRYEDFVKLCERMERKTGRSARISGSW